MYDLLSYLHQQTNSCWLFSWDFHTPPHLSKAQVQYARRPRFRYGSIIIPAACHRASIGSNPMVGLARSTPYDGSSSSPSRSPVRATAGTYLLKGYSVFKELYIAVFVLVLRSGSDEDSRLGYYTTSGISCQEVSRNFFIFFFALIH